MAATLLAKRRLRVRVLDTPFDTGLPTPVFGLETTPLLHPVLDELGLVHDLRTRIFAQPSPIGIILPDRRFSFPADPKQRSIILGEVMPDAQEELLALFGMIERFGPSMDGLLTGELDLGGDGFRARRQQDRIASEFGLSTMIDEKPPWSTSPLVRDLVRCLLTVAGHLDGGPDHVIPGALRSLWHLCFGIPSVRNGRQGMEELLAQKLSVTGGTIEERRIASRLDVRRRRVRTVETEDGAVFGTDAVIIAGGPSALSQLTDTETTGFEYQRTRIPVPLNERPRPFQSPSAWISQNDAPPILLQPDGGEVDMLISGADFPDIRGILPFTKMGRSSISHHEWHAIDADNPFGFFGAEMRSPIKNCLLVGESVMPGLGIEADCVTARQAADLITQSRTGRWPFSKGL